MELQLNKSSASVSVSEQVFGADFNEALIHQVVTAYFAAGRAGTKAQKTRSEVSGGGAKPWKQKGSSRARAGTIRSPIWRKGGVTFAAKPRDYNQKVNRKMYRSALCSILSELNRANRLWVVDQFSFESKKTKDFVKYAQEQGFGNDVLLIGQTVNEELYLASRNLPHVTVADVEAINPVLLLHHQSVVMDKAALEAINKWLS